MDNEKCTCLKDLCNCPFSNKVSANSVAYTKGGFPVYSSASASACSENSFEDAWFNAYGL